MVMPSGQAWPESITIREVLNSEFGWITDSALRPAVQSEWKTQPVVAPLSGVCCLGCASGRGNLQSQICTPYVETYKSVLPLNWVWNAAPEGVNTTKLHSKANPPHLEGSDLNSDPEMFMSCPAHTASMPQRQVASVYVCGRCVCGLWCVCVRVGVGGGWVVSSRLVNPPACTIWPVLPEAEVDIATHEASTRALEAFSPPTYTTPRPVWKGFGAPTRTRECQMLSRQTKPRIGNSRTHRC
jgi:hypothetical protein